MVVVSRLEPEATKTSASLRLPHVMRLFGRRAARVVCSFQVMVSSQIAQSSAVALWLPRTADLSARVGAMRGARAHCALWRMAACRA